MAKTKVGSVEAELQKLTKVKPKDGESTEAYLKRLAKASDDLEDKVWEDASEAAQEFVNELVVAIRKEKDLPEFPADDAEGDEDEDEEDKKPAKAKGGKSKSEDDDAEEDDEKEDEDEDEKPSKAKASKAKKKAAADEDSDDDNGSDDAEDDDGPKKGKKMSKKTKPDKGKTAKADKKEKATTKKADAKKTAKAKPKGKSAVDRIKALVYADPSMKTAEIEKKMAKEGYTATTSTIQSYRADFLHTLRFLKKEGVKGLPDVD